MPLRDMKVNCSFGKRVHPVTGQADFHKGIDLGARSEPVFAILQGTVSATGFHPILGRFVRINHGGIESIYGHLSILTVTIGDMVKPGGIIGVTGSTGRVSGEHLHFSILLSGKYIDPVSFILKLLELDEFFVRLGKSIAVPGYHAK